MLLVVVVVVVVVVFVVVVAADVGCGFASPARTDSFYLFFCVFF